jgi:hypothetical protein
MQNHVWRFCPPTPSTSRHKSFCPPAILFGDGQGGLLMDVSRRLPVWGHLYFATRTDAGEREKTNEH